METYKKAAFDDQVEIWQAGKGVDRIESIESCADVLEGFRKDACKCCCLLASGPFSGNCACATSPWKDAICPKVAASNDAPANQHAVDVALAHEAVDDARVHRATVQMRHESATEES